MFELMMSKCAIFGWSSIFLFFISCAYYMQDTIPFTSIFLNRHLPWKQLIPLFLHSVGWVNWTPLATRLMIAQTQTSNHHDKYCCKENYYSTYIAWSIALINAILIPITTILTSLLWWTMRTTITMITTSSISSTSTTMLCSYRR